MFCHNCGSKLSNNAEFCANCGVAVKKSGTKNKHLGKSEGLVGEKLFGPTFKKIGDFTKKHKKVISIIGAICLVLLVGVILFNKFYDFTKINWDKEYGDIDTTHTMSTTLSLGVKAYDKDNNEITDINFEVTAGKIEVDVNTVEWTLPEKAGKYTIKAIAPSGKKITKEIVVISSDAQDFNYLFGMDPGKVDDNTADNDNDGFTNAEEKNLGTNPDLMDTDRDGLSDYYEIKQSKTDPLKEDSDADGLKDGNELDLELDPLKSDSKGDGIKDGDRDVSCIVSDSDVGVELTINGKGNIATSTIDVFKNSSFSNIKGFLDKVYNFYTDGTITNATVKIKYDLDEIKQNGLTEDDLSIYYFNEETQQLEIVPTTIDKDNKLLIATLSHFSKYLIGIRGDGGGSNNSQIMFVIDNSVSMYSTNQMIDLGYNDSVGAIGNDTEFKRLTLTNRLIDMFGASYKFGVAEFSGNYVNLIKFSNTKDNVKSAVNSIKNNWASNGSGTNIITALKSGITEFDYDYTNNYILLLTDGRNTSGSLSAEKANIINNANNKNIKICVIGLGKEVDAEELKHIAKATGCDYYNATDSSALDEIYSLVGANINYNYVDTDGNGVIDGMIQVNSGFIINRDGFSFANFSSNKSAGGHCYGMAAFANLYFRGQLPMSLGYAHKKNIVKQYVPSDGYDLYNTYFENYNNLFDYKPENYGVKFYLYRPMDFRNRIENNTWMINERYYDYMKDIGITFSIEEEKKSSAYFNKYQIPMIHIDSEKLETSVPKDDSQILSAIYRLFILQIDDDRFMFSSKPDKSFEKMKEDLLMGNPIITSVAGNHAVNAIKLIQDIHNANKFKIEVYDNNFPGETRYIEVTRSKFSKVQLNYVAWANEYEYTFKYDANNDGVKETLKVGLHYPKVS